MTTQEKILNQLQVLETLSKQGAYSDKFVLALRNLILQEINSIEEEIQEIAIDLQTFEQQYKLSSAQFYQQFKSGELGDAIDFVEWSAFYQMWCSLQERLNILNSQV
jgi:pyruvate-formate lyase-activating enzyme